MKKRYYIPTMIWLSMLGIIHSPKTFAFSDSFEYKKQNVQLSHQYLEKKELEESTGHLWPVCSEVILPTFKRKQLATSFGIVRDQERRLDIVFLPTFSKTNQSIFRQVIIREGFSESSIEQYRQKYELSVVAPETCIYQKEELKPLDDRYEIQTPLTQSDVAKLISRFNNETNSEFFVEFKSAEQVRYKLSKSDADTIFKLLSEGNISQAKLFSVKNGEPFIFQYDIWISKDKKGEVFMSGGDSGGGGGGHRPPSFFQGGDMGGGGLFVLAKRKEVSDERYN